MKEPRQFKHFQEIFEDEPLVIWASPSEVAECVETMREAIEAFKSASEWGALRKDRRAVFERMAKQLERVCSMIDHQGMVPPELMRALSECAKRTMPNDERREIHFIVKAIEDYISRLNKK